ncbi:restriction endonuclease subunit S [Amycolatopsis sp. NPDC051716]|uniref:restriction endonuclease subunit S n=1 Tax=Amycolatopsis sp. NPDC051716 TaxID=3155804 RepID=UPI0034133E59
MSKKSPQLRFEGFTDDWEERKFSNLAEVRRGLTYKPSDVQKYGIRVLRSSNIAEDTFLIKSDDVFVNKEAVKIDKVKNGDILITSANGSSRLVGKHALIEGIENDTVHGGFMLVARAEKPEFVNAIMSSSWYSKFINIFVSGGNGAIGNLSKSDLEDQKVYVPSEIEQTKIGLFFKGLDDTIALHQRKLDLLKEQKKGYLQKMFSKNGEKVPELRFAGFADDWEERKLSDVANHRGGTAIEKYFDKYGVYKVISIGSYGLNSQYVDQNIRAISNEITDGRVVNSGELTMVLNDKTANGTIIGRTLLVEKDNEYVINQRTEIISPKENFDSNFAYTILNGPFREKVKRIVQGGTQIYVNYPAVSNLNLELPKIEEQQKIGSFFKQLDDTIALHQRKLDLLKEQKKGFLQKMFV